MPVPPVPPVDPWTIPSIAVREAFRHREEIQSIWGRLSTLLLGHRSRLAITGAEGAGKTVLADHVTGTAYRSDYFPPGQSEATENLKMIAKKQRIGLAVLPGQENTIRREALDELFDGKKPVDGVIHVVDNGYARPRDWLAERALDEAGTTLAELREARWEKEIEVVAGICERVRGMMGRHPAAKPWFLIVANKADLFCEAEDLRAARERYLGGDFWSPIQKLQNDVGTDRLQVRACPVSAWLEDFHWGNDVVRSQYSLGQRDASVRDLAKTIEGLCKARG
jgi:hypothetical protein